MRRLTGCRIPAVVHHSIANACLASGLVHVVPDQKVNLTVCMQVDKVALPTPGLGGAAFNFNADLQQPADQSGLSHLPSKGRAIRKHDAAPAVGEWHGSSSCRSRGGSADTKQCKAAPAATPDLMGLTRLVFISGSDFSYVDLRYIAVGTGSSPGSYALWFIINPTFAMCGGGKKQLLVGYTYSPATKRVNVCLVPSPTCPPCSLCGCTISQADLAVRSCVSWLPWL